MRAGVWPCVACAEVVESVELKSRAITSTHDGHPSSVEMNLDTRRNRLGCSNTSLDTLRMKMTAPEAVAVRLWRLQRSKSSLMDGHDTVGNATRQSSKPIDRIIAAVVDTVFSKWTTSECLRERIKESSWTSTDQRSMIIVAHGCSAA